MQYYYLLRITDNTGTSWMGVVNEMSDTVRVYGLEQSFNFEFSNLRQWCEAYRFNYKVVRQSISLKDF